MSAKSNSPDNHDKKKKDLNPFADLELRSLRDYYMIIRERFLLAAACALIVSCGVGYFLLSQPAVYESEAALLIDRQGERVVDIDQVVDTGLEGSGQMVGALLENHIQQLTSRNFRNYVVDSFSESEKERIVTPYRHQDPDREQPQPAGILRENIEVENVRNSFVLNIAVRHRNPDVAALIADRYVDQYIRFNMDRSQVGNTAAVGFLTEQAEELRERVEQADRALQEYRQEHNLVSVEENQNLIVQRLQEISANVTAARVARLDLEARMRQVEEFQEEDKNLLEIGAISTYGSNRAIADELDELRQKREVMSERYGHRHPRMIENERAIQTAERRVQENVELAIAELRSRLRNARDKEESLVAELRDAERESLNLDQLTIEYQVLRRAAEGARATHQQILNRLNETSITSQLENTNIRIVDRAEAPRNPVEPNIKKVALLVVFLGGFFFVGVPLGLEFFDNKLKTAWDVEHFLDQRLAGEVPSLKKIAEAERPHVVEKEVDDSAVEAFRGVLSQMELTSRVDFPKSLAVTSTLPAEGKSFIVSNLGFSFSAFRKKTLIVDCDFRRPVMHRLYNLDNKHGILRWLNEENEVTDDSIHDESLGVTEVAPNLYILRAGGHTKKVPETISHPKLEKLFSALSKHFDMVLIDTPPVGVFPDALSLAGFADEALYVCRVGKPDRQQVKSFLNRMEETDADLIGVLLNDMPSGRASASYYSGYGYGHYGNKQYQKYYANQA